MTKYHIEKAKKGFNVLITTEYRTHKVNVTEELLGLRMIYFSNKPKERSRLVSQWNSGKYNNDLMITKEDNVNINISDSYILCDLALSEAIVQMINNSKKGGKSYGL